jgi:hypothetical protein
VVREHAPGRTVGCDSCVHKFGVALDVSRVTFRRARARSRPATISTIPPTTNVERSPMAAARAPLARAPTTMTPRVNMRADTLTRPRRRFGVSRCCSERATGMRAPAGIPPRRAAAFRCLTDDLQQSPCGTLSCPVRIEDVAAVGDEFPELVERPRRCRRRAGRHFCSNRDGLLADVVIAILQATDRHHVNVRTEQRLERLLEIHQVEQRTPRFELDQEGRNRCQRGRHRGPRNRTATPPVRDGDGRVR